jgi:hypothetical protein
LQQRSWTGFKIGPESGLTQDECNALWRAGLVGRVTETAAERKVTLTYEEKLADRRRKYHDDPVYRATVNERVRKSRAKKREMDNGKNK